MGVGKCIPDGRLDSLGIVQNLVIPESQHAKTGFFQQQCAFVVVDDLARVLSAVNFDDKTRFEANEIQDIAEYRLLPAELEAVQLAAAQLTPQNTLCVRR